MWLKNTDGKRDSALTLKMFWNLVTAGLVAWAAYKNGVDLELLIFTGAMAGMESVAYVVRRGQQHRADVAAVELANRPTAP